MLNIFKVKKKKIPERRQWRRSCVFIVIHLSHISYNDETWHSYTLPKEDPKNIWTTWNTPDFWWSQHFFTGSQQILLYQEIQIKIAFWYIIFNSFDFSSVFKSFLINFIIILMMSARMATLNLLKLTVFSNKGYDVITPVDEVINKILSRDSIYIVDVFMWPKFGNCSISMREVIITSIL